MAKTGVGSVYVDLEVNDKKYDKQINSKLKGTENAFSSTFKKVGGFVASAFAVKKVTDFTKNCIDSASKVQSAFTGLNSIVQGTGNSFSQAQKFVKEYTKDGLVSLQETATAYKNLLARGYDTSQIEDVMTRLKDSAAFGRQASYDLGEAVVTATEGLKNENSILVDNAGVTKNVSKMWEEWAKAHGTSTAAMTQAEKIQAEYNGIMQETRFQVGDAARYTKTFSGQIQQLKFNFNQMTVAIGKVVAPLAQLFIPVINSAISAVTKFFVSLQSLLKVFGLEMPDVVSKASSSIGGIESSAMAAASGIDSTGDSAVKAAKKISRAFGSVDEINVLNTKQDTSSESSSLGSSDVSASSTPFIDTSSIEQAADSTSNLLGIAAKVKETLANIWNSSPVQAFVGAVNSYGDFLLTYWTTLGTNLWNNIQGTWSNIKGDVSNTLNNMSSLWTLFWQNIQSGIDTWGQPIIDGVSGLFNSIWADVMDPAIQLMTTTWADFSGILLELWNEYGVPLVNNIGDFVNTTIGLFQKIWDDVLNPIVTPFLESLSWLWDKHISKMVQSIGEFIGKLVNGALEIYNKFIVPIVGFLMDVLSPAWAFLSSVIIDTFGTAFAFISDIISSIFKLLGGVIDFVTGIFTGNWKKAWNGVVSVFDGIISGIIAIFKAPINYIIDGINSFIRGLNALKIPDWVPAVGGLSLNIPTIPKLAQGGWFAPNNPQLAIVGDNTREPEVVTPESKIYEQVMKANRDSKGNASQPMEWHIYVHYEDGRTIIKKINQTQIEAGEILLEV